jgi:hypothetical protein
MGNMWDHSFSSSLAKLNGVNNCDSEKTHQHAHYTHMMK